MLTRPSSAIVIAEARDVDDVDAMAVTICDGVECECIQIDSTRCRGRSTTVRCEPMSFQFGAEEGAVVRHMRVPQTRWALIVPLSDAESRWNGRTLSARDVVVCPPASDALWLSPAGARFAVVTADAATALASGHDLSESTGGIVAGLRADDHAALHAALISLRDGAEKEALVDGRHPGQQLLALIRECLTHASLPRGDGGAHARRQRIVSSAEQFFRRNITEGVSMTQLSTLVGVSERSLRNAFYDVCTTSPKRYMKLWQLHSVRRALRATPVNGTTVTAVATDHGLYELGRFAGAYKSLFGETPSETLHKSRLRQAAVAHPTN